MVTCMSQGTLTKVLAGALIAVVILSMYTWMNYVSTKNQLSSLEGKYLSTLNKLSRAHEELRSKELLINNLSRELSSVRIKLINISSHYQILSKSYNELMSKYLGLSNEVRKLRSAYELLKLNHTLLKSKYSVLKVRYDELSSKYSRLLNTLSKLRSNYTVLKTSYHNLYNKYSVLLGKYELLNKSYVRALSRIRELSSRVSYLESRNNELVRENNELSSKVSKLEDEVSYLRYRIDEVRRELKDVLHNAYLSMIMNGIGWNRNVTELSKLLRKAISEGESLVGSLGIENSLTPGKKVFAAAYWIFLNFEYINDSKFSYVDASGMLSSDDNRLYLPNEVIKRGGGDCEDLALLAYSILKVLGGGKVYLIGWYVGKLGHVAVLYLASNGQAFILDPAGNWVNGMSFVLTLEVKDTSGKYWYIYLSPLDMDADLKSFLINNNFTYWQLYDNFKNKYYRLSEGIIYYKYLVTKESLMDLISDWLNYWGVSPNSYRIYDVGTIKEFSSVSELVNWLMSG